MSDTKTKTATSGISFSSILAVLFIGLKLTGHIDWSWWWVLSPLWIPLAGALAIILIIAIGAVIVTIFSK